MRKNVYTSLMALLGALLTAPQGHAAVVLVGTGYSENFNEPKLSNTPVTPQWNGTTQAAVPGTSGWDGVRLSGTGTAMNYSVNDGSSNSGALYSYGATASTERALGAVASGTNIGAIGVEIVNGNAQAIDAVSVQYIGEFWRSSTSTQNKLTFAYSVGPSGSTNYLSVAGATALAALDLVGPAFVAANGALDGNVAPNRGSFNGVINVNVPAGQSLYLRWQDNNDIGNDAGLAIDDFELTANLAVPEPSSVILAALGLAGLAWVSRRRLTGHANR